MKLGILSDSHDNLRNLTAALNLFRMAGVTQLIHCGDMTSPGTAQRLAGFKVIYVDGNMDRDPVAIAERIRALDSANFAGATFEGEIGGARIAVTHGHMQDEVDRLTAAGNLDYLFLGHTHRRRHERTGTIRVINPGALGGVRWQSRSVVLLDLGSGEAQFMAIKGA